MRPVRLASDVVAGNTWDAEHEVDEQLARRLLAGQFPQLALESVVPLAYGFDNTVYVVDGTWAVRFPRRQMGADLFAQEVGLLPALAPLLPVPIPVPELVGRPQGDYPWPFWGGPLLGGVELADAGLPDAHREPLGAAIGAFLRVLHAPDVARAYGTGMAHDPMQRATPSVRGPLGRTSLDRLVVQGHWAHGSPADVAYDELVAEGAPLGPPTGPEVLVHGDLHLRHVLVDDRGLPTGVIDWGDACLADPARDLSFGYAALAGPARDAFFAAYGDPPDREREVRCRVLAAAVSAVLAEYAVTEGMPALLAESLAGIERALV